MIPKIVELKITEDELISGVDAIAFVEQPAIEIDFLAFNKEEFQSFNDYPQAAIDNAKIGIKRNEELGNKCGTQVGKVRAQQLANGEPVSLDTIRRMRAFLIRQKDNYDLAISRKDYDACGYISYMLWGGPEALPWAEKKLRQAGEDFEEFIEPNPCQEGYIAYGTKIKDGREVPNCVPKQMSKEEKQIFEGFLVEKLIELELSKEQWVEELTDDIEDIVYSALLNVGKTDEDLLDEGYDFENAVAIDDKEQFAISSAEIKSLVSKDDYEKPSVEDFGTQHIFYKYTRYDGKEDYSSNSREFCKNIIKANRWFRREDINKLTLAGANEGFGLQGQKFYDIFSFKGGKNCQHYWRAFRIPRSEEARRKNESTNKSIERVSEATTLNPDTLATLIAQGRKFASQEMMDDKRLVATPIMVPNKLIPRLDENGEKYYVYFTEDTIKQIAYKYAENKNHDKINHEHDMESMVDGVYLAESWMIEESKNDKSNIYGYNLPKGTWFGIFKVNNGDYWKDYIKTGKVKGVSVEGYFINKLTQLA